MLMEIEIDEFISKKPEFDLLIDARSPKEFAESHIAKSQNFYALNDAEHKEVGTLYKQISRNDAKALGAQYICQNVALHIQEIYKNYKIGSKIGIYCAKGGLRSSSIALILSNIGYQVYRLIGGYKSYRFFAISYLENLPHKNFIVLGGNTGCGKSELLQDLPNAIDLEKMANHLGSTFGSIKGAQPTQKEFQNRLVEVFSTTDVNAYIFIEGESVRMGKVMLPSKLHEAMKESFRVEVTAPLSQRVERILKDYYAITPDFFYSSMETITPYIKKSSKEEAIIAYEKGDLASVAQILLVDYYDVVYKKPKRVDSVIENDEHTQTIEALKALHVSFKNCAYDSVSD